MEAVLTTEFEREWETVQRGIDRVVSFIDAGGINLNPDAEKDRLTTNDFISIYTTVYTMCATACSRKQLIIKLELYNRYKTFCQQYAHTKVLPALREKNRESLLREVVKRWCDYKNATRLVSKFFSHIDYHIVRRDCYPTLHDTTLLILQQQVYEEMKRQIIASILTLIREDRDGNTTDRAMIKKVLETVYDLESQMSRVSYQIDFEHALLRSSYAYYCTKFKYWSHTLTSEENISQVTEFINAERSRVEQFLCPITMNKLLEVIISNVQSKQLERGTDNLVQAIEGLTLTDDVDMC